MKLFETPHNGQVYGYLVGTNGVQKITKKAQAVMIACKDDKVGEYTVHFDLTKLPMYTIA